MKKLLEITDSSLGLPHDEAPKDWEERRAARVVVTDVATGTVALLHATKYNYHKLPGGGVDEDESLEDTMRRESLEEIGCHVKNVQELGFIEERRSKHGLHQISYCYTGELDGPIGTPKLEPGEVAEGFMTVWVPLDEAVAFLESELQNDNYDAKFMTLRDLTFLKNAQATFITS